MKTHFQPLIQTLMITQVDGSENSETIPMRALVVPERKVDFIVAFDSSGEEPGNLWVNGTTFGRSATNAKTLGIPFPPVPDSATFVNLGFNQYPVCLLPEIQLDTSIRADHAVTLDLLRLRHIRRYAANPLRS